MAPSALPMLQKTELTEFASASSRSTVAERRGRVEVVHALPVDGAVAGVVEGRLGLELARLERGRGGDHLERGARHVETRARAVEERRGRPAVGLDLRDAPEAALDEVRVEARRGRHHQHLARARVERGDRSALVAEALERDGLCLEVERGHDVVPLHGLAADAVERLVHERREVRVRRRQVVVQRALEPRPRAADRAVAHDVSGELALRVHAEEERPPVDLLLDVPREPLARRPLQKTSPRSTENSATRLIALSWRSLRPATAHVCQYVVITTSAPTRISATYVSRMIWRFIAARAPVRSRGSRRAAALRAEGSSRRCSCLRRRRTGA